MKVTDVRQELSTLRRQRATLDGKIEALEALLEAYTGNGSPAGRTLSGRRLGLAASGQPDNEPSPEAREKVLEALEGVHGPGMLRTELETITGINSSTMTNVLAALIRDGMVEQANAPAKRSTRWMLADRERVLHAGHGEVK